MIYADEARYLAETSSAAWEKLREKALNAVDGRIRTEASEGKYEITVSIANMVDQYTTTIGTLQRLLDMLVKELKRHKFTVQQVEGAFYVLSIGWKPAPLDTVMQTQQEVH